MAGTCPVNGNRDGKETVRQERNLRVITSHRRTDGWTKGQKWSWGKA